MSTTFNNFSDILHRLLISQITFEENCEGKCCIATIFIVVEFLTRLWNKKCLQFLQYRIPNSVCQSFHQIHSIEFYLSIWFVQNYCFEFPYEYQTLYGASIKLSKTIHKENKFYHCRTTENGKKSVQRCSPKWKCFRLYISVNGSKELRTEQYHQGNGTHYKLTLSYEWFEVERQQETMKTSQRKNERDQTNGTKLHSSIRDRLRFLLAFVHQ